MEICPPIPSTEGVLAGIPNRTERAVKLLIGRRSFNPKWASTMSSIVTFFANDILPDSRGPSKPTVEFISFFFSEYLGWYLLIVSRIYSIILFIYTFSIFLRGKCNVTLCVSTRPSESSCLALFNALPISFSQK
jgi:hypothetical protein